MEPTAPSSTADATARLLASTRREAPSSNTPQSSISTTTTTTRTRVPPSLAASTTSLAASTSLYSSTASSRPRHSLYGTEDRVVLDLGSRIWKFGFSGEAKPRACKSVLKMIGEESNDVKGMTGKSLGLWGLEKGEVGDLEWEIREQRLKKGLRDVWFNHLMSDPKARKVIIVENLLMSTRVKEMLVRVLFENLQVPSITFASGHLLSLLATGNVTGLVVDSGNLETTCLPIYCSRPLFPLFVSTPTGGSRLNKRLKSLLLHFGSYIPAATSITSSVLPQIIKIPKEVLSEEFLEEIKTRLCFVGEKIIPSDDIEDLFPDTEAMDIRSDSITEEEYQEAEDLVLMTRMEKNYSRNSTATTISFKVPSLSLGPVISGVGRGWIKIPGWIRERAAEVLFEEGDEDEFSLTEVILESLLRLPLDLRRPLASSILITGGTAMIPGFFPRLRTELLTNLSLSQPSTSPQTPPLSPSNTPKNLATFLSRQRLQSRLSLLRTSPRFAPLVSLIASLTITNDPSIVSTLVEVPFPVGEGKAPGFNPSLLAWIGGSLAGALKTGGEELLREKWEYVNIASDNEDERERVRRAVPDSSARRVVS